ncbi:MAG: STAS domain-containing protein [Spirochaetaceae bacterium]
MDITEEARGAVTVLHLSGKLDLFNAKNLRQKVQELLESGWRKIIIDFGGVSYMDSSGVGALLHVYASARAENFETRFVNFQKPVARVIELTKLTDYFPLSDSVESAAEELE